MGKIQGRYIQFFNNGEYFYGNAKNGELKGHFVRFTLEKGFEDVFLISNQII